MKNRTNGIARLAWDVLSDVPGWRDAGPGPRIRRASVVLLPFFAAFVLMAADWLWMEPGREAARSEHEELLLTQEEIAGLAGAMSDDEVVALEARAAAITAEIFSTPEEATPWLERLEDRIHNMGWKASFHTYDSSSRDESSADSIQYLSALARLAPLPGNENRVRTLLESIDAISSSGKRIDLTRMAVRADEPGSPAVEINLRIALLPIHETTAQ